MESPIKGNTTTNSSPNKKRARQQQNQKGQRRLRHPRTTIYLVVVESHQHVLEHIHAVLRKERLLTKEWSMLHFDAHPDLACPNPTIPAKACFLPHEAFPIIARNSSSHSTTNNDSNNGTNGQEEPTLPQEKNLYELLDSTATGIAEWILPLVLAANLRRVHWIKPAAVAEIGEKESSISKPPSQLPCGVHDYHVGASIPAFAITSGMNDGCYASFMDLPPSATVKVDWPHPYYLEDDCTAHFGKDDEKIKEELFLLPKPFRLQVSSLLEPAMVDWQTDSTPPPPATTLPSASGTTNTLWELDICLDYFACQNPFLTDLEAKDPVFSKALLKAVFQSRFYASSIMATPSNSARSSSNPPTNGSKELNALQHYRHDMRQFWGFLVDQLNSSREHHQAGGDKAAGNDDGRDYIVEAGLVDKYYADPSIGHACLNELVRAFCSSPYHSQEDSTITTTAAEGLVTMTRQALPNLTMPHHSFPSVQNRTGENNGTNSMTTTATTSTPQWSISMESIRPALEQVQQEIEERYRGTDSVSTKVEASERSTEIATSSDDTPPFMITIARSCNDGFTPSHIADDLQEAIIRQLHSLYCGCGKVLVHRGKDREDTTKVGSDECRFQIIMDYGPWEGTSFF